MKWFKKLGVTVSMFALASGVFAAAATAYDLYEPNDTLATATPMPFHFEQDRFSGIQYPVYEVVSNISTPTDVDYYKLVPYASKYISLAHPVGFDYDFEVYDEYGNLIASATSTATYETVTFSTSAVRYVKVYSKNGTYSGDMNKPYRLNAA
ncbi:hypothetical protein PCURB6_43020 [Paenibacillus curdlanolyticus]|nr:hypothetical protein PCURB6_43020 [Paenibacillus curdlanolyticus]